MSEKILDQGQMAVGEAAANVTIATIDARVKAQDAAEAVGQKAEEVNKTIQDIFPEPKLESDVIEKNDKDLDIATKDGK